MLTDIENKVQELYGCLSDSSAHDLASSLVSDIIYICGENINDQTICMPVPLLSQLKLLTCQVFSFIFISNSSILSIHILQA